MACVLAAVLLAVFSKSPMRRQTARLASDRPGALMAGAGPTRREVPRLEGAAAQASRLHRARARPRELPKLDQFPQPQPVSEQERQMLAFVSAASPQNQRVAAEAAEPPEFVRAAGMQVPMTQTYRLETEVIGAPHGEDR